MTAAAYTKYRAVFRRPYLGCEYPNGTTIGGQYRGKSQARMPGPQVKVARQSTLPGRSEPPSRSAVRTMAHFDDTVPGNSLIAVTHFNLQAILVARHSGPPRPFFFINDVRATSDVAVDPGTAGWSLLAQWIPTSDGCGSKTRDGCCTKRASLCHTAATTVAQGRPSGPPARCRRNFAVESGRTTASRQGCLLVPTKRETTHARSAIELLRILQLGDPVPRAHAS